MITAIATVLPPGAGISMRRTPSSKPRPASVASVGVDVALQRQQEEAERGAVGRRRRCLDALEHDEFDDAGVGCGRVAEEDRPQPIGRRIEQGRPVAGEGVVEQLGEAEAVAPEPHRGSTSAVTIAVWWTPVTR